MRRVDKIVSFTLALMATLAFPLLLKAQQQPQYTQYLFSGLVINPAYAGTDEALSATFIDRHQWTGIEGAPVTQTMALHTLSKKRKVGLGIVLSNDRIGIHRNTSGQLSYAYHLQVAKKSYLAFGLQAGGFYVKSDYGSLINANSPDPKLSNYSINQFFFDFGAGVYFRSPKLHIGISSPTLLDKSAQVNDTTAIRFNSLQLFGFVKYKATLSPFWEIEPALLVKHIGNLPVSADGTLTFIYKTVLTMGTSYRFKESIGALLKAKATPQLQIGYAYDYPVGPVSKLSNGSHEFMVQYLFKFERSGVNSPRIRTR
jgi:type IX secretion system PorP/SprF family membrane protein